MSDIIVVRKPIITRGLEVHGYEVLFHGAHAASWGGVDEATAASGVLNAFLLIGLERVVGHRKAFVRCSRSMIQAGLLRPFASEHLVVVLRGRVRPDAVLRGALRELSEAGAAIALDGFRDGSSLTSLLDVATFVVLDCSSLDGARLEGEILALDGWDGQIIARSIATRETFDRCGELGVNLFQGSFLGKPQIKAGRGVPSNKLALVRVLASVNDPNIGLDELAAVIEQDAGLAYTLVRHANSVLYGLPRRVDKVREVAMLLGMDRVRSLTNLLLLSQVDDKPRELLSAALIRAKMCECLSTGKDGLSPSTYFSTGLFSNLDALLDAPMQSVLKQLPLDDTIVSALTGKQNTRLRSCLECVLAYERGDWEQALSLDSPFEEVGGAYLSALDFATSIEQMKVAA